MLQAKLPNIHFEKYKLFLNGQEQDYLISGDEVVDQLNEIGFDELDHPQVFERARAGYFIYSGAGTVRFEKID